MAPVLDDAEVWLKPHFLPEMADNAVVEGKMWRTEPNVKVSLPRKEFMHEFGLWSDVASPVESWLTAESEEEDFLAELTQMLKIAEARKFLPLDLYKTREVPKVAGGSPQSILGGIGSWSGRSSNQSPIQKPSPPATPFENEYDPWMLIHAAPGQLERLKMNVEAPLNTSVNGQLRAVSNPKLEQNRFPSVQNHQANLLAEQQLNQNRKAAVRQAQQAALLYEERLKILQLSEKFASSRCDLAPEHVVHSAWPPLHRPQFHQPSVQARVNSPTAPLLKKGSVGTGVFLPRRYNTVPAAEPRRTVPNAVVPARNASIEKMNGRTRPHYSAYAASMSQQTYEALMARRNAFLVQQQRENSKADDLVQSNLQVCLPQEWSY